MSDALKNFLEESVLTESAKASIAEFFQQKVQEAREEVAANLRDEFALKYEKDRSELVEAMDAMIRESMTAQVSELAEAKKAAMEEKVVSKKKLKESIDLIESFIKTRMAVEMNEFKADRKVTAETVSNLHNVVKESLKVELEEFHEEKRKLYEDRVQNKIKANKALMETKKNMVNKMANIAEGFIRKHLVEEMTQLKEDLIESRKKHLGMKIFEAFASEYNSSFFSERKEVKKLVKIIENKDSEIEKSREEIAKRDKMLIESTNRTRIAEDRFARAKTLAELVSPLSGSKRKLMEELLEKVPTNKLTESFNSYLPAVLSEQRVTTKKETVLTESTGNKETLLSKANTASEGNTAVANEVLSKLHLMNNHVVNKNKI